MRQVIISSSVFGKSCLNSVSDGLEDIILIIGLERSEYDSDYGELEHFAATHGINFLRTRNVNSSEIIAVLEDMAPDVIWVLGWPFLLGSKLLSVARLGNIGYHPSLLPHNKGRHPIIWAIVLGLKVTGSTFFVLDEGADTGPIISQSKIPIAPNETSTSLYAKILEVGVEQFKILWRDVDSRIQSACPQVRDESNSWRKRSQKDGVIDWRMSSKSIVRLVNALKAPYGGASFYIDNDEYKLLEADFFSFEKKIENLEPGKVLSFEEDGSAIVKSGDGVIKIITTDRYVDWHNVNYL